MILIEKNPTFWLVHDYLISENFQKKAVKSPSAKKTRESRRISAKPRRKNPVKARRTLGEKNLAKARRNLGENVRLEKFLVSQGEANGARVRLGSPPFALGETQGANLHLWPNWLVHDTNHGHDKNRKTLLNFWLTHTQSMSKISWVHSKKSVSEYEWAWVEQFSKFVSMSSVSSSFLKSPWVWVAWVA
jgi:hypothetical protein